MKTIASVETNEFRPNPALATYRAGLTDFLAVLDAERELYTNEDLLAQRRTTRR